MTSSCGPQKFPKWVRTILTLFACEKCCAKHDEMYKNVTNDEERLVADKQFRDCLIQHIPKWRVKVIMFLVEKYGHKYVG